MNKQEFISSIKEGAVKGQADYGILPSLTIAQAILESGWGSSQLSLKANNLFGIKAFSNWEGERITLPTTEWYDNEKQIVNADFRAYDSLNDSIEDHSKLLSNSRYKQVRECTGYKEACEKIYECGYATDPAYAGKLIKIIEENKLYEFDSISEYSEAAAELEGIESSEGRILKFQKLCNKLGISDSEGKALREDGILGPKTKSCFARMPILREGSKGIAVEFIQDIVGAEPIDGDFGPITLEMVIEFQRNSNIGVDGIVGKETWTSIITI
jgi:peptidoglycan hydrolase-like protein with peptidoglycan-binding domain